MKTTILFLSILLLHALHFLPHSLQAQCTNGQSLMTIAVQTDANYQETSMKIHDLTSGTTIWTLPAGSQAANTLQTYTVCATNANCFKADLLDSGGNGGATFTIYFQSNVYSSASATGYGYISTALMGGSTCPTYSEVFDSASYFIRSAGPIKVGDKNKFVGSVMANKSGGDICMGSRNTVTGWVKGDKVGMPTGNIIAGINGIGIFGNDWGAGVCSQSSAMPVDDMAVLAKPQTNSTDCEVQPVVPSLVHINLNGPGSTQTIDPGNYGVIEVNNGATLYLNAGQYTMGQLSLSNGKLMPAGGGTLCEILISSDKVSFTVGSTVHATINCESVHVGNNNVFKGVLETTDSSEPMLIGNGNLFEGPTCPPCEEGKINKLRNPKRGHGSIDATPEFKTWPNPSDSGEIHFSYAQDGSLDIFDLQGEKVMSVELVNTNIGIESTYTLDVQDLKPGMYIGRMTTASGQVASQKITLLGM